MWFPFSSLTHIGVLPHQHLLHCHHFFQEESKSWLATNKNKAILQEKKGRGKSYILGTLVQDTKLRLMEEQACLTGDKVSVKIQTTEEYQIYYNVFWLRANHKTET